MCALQSNKIHSQGYSAIFSKRGLISALGTSWIVPRLVGIGWAMDLLWTSRMIDAEKAVQLGLVQHLTNPSANARVSYLGTAGMLFTTSQIFIKPGQRQVMGLLSSLGVYIVVVDTRDDD